MAATSSVNSKMDIDEAAIDEGLYSRQLYAFIPFVIEASDQRSNR
jgi:hypothetical protein